MNKKILKKLIIILLLITIYFLISNICVEANITDQFQGNLNETEVGSIQKIIGSVLSIIRTVGVFIAVGILMVIACKYMIASAGDRADIKKYAISYIIGAVILFATSGIAAILKQIIDASFGT